MRFLAENPFYKQLVALFLVLLCAPLLLIGANANLGSASAGLILFGLSLGLTLWNPKKKR